MDDEILFWLDHLHERSPEGAAARDAIPVIWQQNPSKLIAALREARHVIRARAADALGMLADPAAVPALLDALHDEIDAVRGHAASALGRIGDRRATEPLIAMLRDPDVWLRWAAAEALGSLGDPAAAVPLLDAWLNAEHEALLNVITEAFRRIGQAAIPALQEAQRGEDANMQRAAAYMIVQIEESTKFTDYTN